jgi:hypothetical protein
MLVKIVISKYMVYHLMNVRENRRGNQKWTTQRDRQHKVHKTKRQIPITKARNITSITVNTMANISPIVNRSDNVNDEVIVTCAVK